MKNRATSAFAENAAPELEMVLKVIGIPITHSSNNQRDSILACIAAAQTFEQIAEIEKGIGYVEFNTLLETRHDIVVGLFSKLNEIFHQVAVEIAANDPEKRVVLAISKEDTADENNNDTIVVYLDREYQIARLANDIKGAFNSLCETEQDRHQLMAEILNAVGLRDAEAAAPVPPAQEADLPTQAPALWLKRENRAETPPEFIKREYAPWLGCGLTQAHIRRLDKSLYMALHKWLQSHDWPADLDLPTQKELNDRQLAAAGLPADPAQADARSRERMRLNAMAQARLFRADRR